MSCLTSAIEPLRAANEISGIDAFAWKIISEDGERVDSSAKVGIDPDLVLGETAGFDCLFLLSGPNANFASPKISNGHLRWMVRHGVNMAVPAAVFFRWRARGCWMVCPVAFTGATRQHSPPSFRV